MTHLQEKLIGIILEAESNALLGNELKDKKMLKEAQCDRVAKQILQLIQKEILGVLPKEKEEEIPNDLAHVRFSAVVFNECLSEVKEKIKELFK